MTHYPSPWPAAIATMVAAVLVGGGTIGGVLLTLKANRQEKQRDRRSDTLARDRVQRIEAYAEINIQLTRLYAYAAGMARVLQGVDPPTTDIDFDVDAWQRASMRASLLCHDKTTLDRINTSLDLGTKLLQAVNGMTKTHADSSTSFEEIKLSFGTHCDTLASAFRSELQNQS